MTAAGEQGRPVTVADVAREVGTSPSTASRALSGRGYVAADLRERLLAAADRLGYVANASAQTLKQRTSRIVGVVVSDLGNPFYGGLAAGIEQTLREAGYRMLLVGDNSEYVEEMAAVRTFLAMRAPGVILTPVGQEATGFLIRNGIAVVEVDRQMADVAVDAVVLDNVRGARDAVGHLLGLGHRRVALLGVDTNWTSDAGRIEGYRFAHATAGITVNDGLILRLGFHEPAAEKRIARLLDEAAPTAIFATNNLLAEQAWRVLRERGLRLPRDVSLVGFDDVAWTAMVSPPITVVAQPTTDLGRRAAALLLQRIADPDRTPTVELLQPRLVVRGSSAPPPRPRR
ncbi:MAG TPA: LacI family DNA-binding transcriptional regulator [Solirubrobacteraceae bacterium]|nr:LacI family DNA-binding transcriptional regulator [Solirubrobacteraceae bacterium]